MANQPPTPNTPSPKTAQPAPGSWTHGTDFSPSSMQAVVRGPDGSTLAKVGARYTPRSRSVQVEAHARLMATAPDLLETCNPDLLDDARSVLIDHPDLLDRLLRKAQAERAAIAKATGGV